MKFTSSSKKIFISVLSLSFALISSSLVFISPVHANEDNQRNLHASFGSCPNPDGQRIAYYANGYHWIVGNSQLQWGSDAVYSQGDNNFTQCFCPLTLQNQSTDGHGTQTNWLYAANMNNEQKQMYLKQGWRDVPDGTAFGLSSGEYLALNRGFNCNHQVECNTDVTQQNNNNDTTHHNDADTSDINHTPMMMDHMRTQFMGNNRFSTGNN